MSTRGFKIAFAAVVVAGLAGSWIYYRGQSSGAKNDQLHEVRRTIVAKAGEGKVIQQQRLLAGKAAATSSARSNASRGRYENARRVLRVADSVGEIPKKLEQPVTDLVQHSDDVERENLDLRQLAHVDTASIKNLTEQLGLAHQELELTPKASRCGAKCGAVIGGLVTLAVIIAAGSR